MALTRKPLVSFLRLDQSYEAQIRKILRDSAADVERDIMRANARSLNPLSQIQLQAQRAAIRARLDQDWSDIERAIAQGRVSSAQLAGKVATDMQSPLLSRILPGDGVQAMAASEAARAGAGVESVLARLTSSYKPLSERVYNNAALSGGRVDRLVNSALARGLSARQFAQEARALIDPNVRGGVSYAAMRLARTELNNAFHATTVDRYQQNETVGRVDWNLSGSHKHLDICDLLASRSYDPKRVPEKPHPQCFCFITPQLLRPDEFMSRLEAGAYDDKPWFQEMIPRIVGGAALSAGIRVGAERLLINALNVEQRLAALKTEVTAARALVGSPTAREILALERGAVRAEAALAIREAPLLTEERIQQLANSLQNLQSAYKTGYQVLREIGDGSSTVRLVEFKDRSRGAIKIGDGSYLSNEAQREQLGYRLLKALDVEGANPAFADGSYTVSRFVDNALTGDEWFQQVGRAVTDGVPFTPEVAAARDALYRQQLAGLVGAREMGLFDWLVQNADRHGGNWFVKDGRIVPLDQGAIFDHRRNALGELDFSLSFPNEFSEYALTFDEAGRLTGSSQYTLGELHRIRNQIVRTRPEFARLGQEAWFQDVLDTMDDLIERVEKGTAARAVKPRVVRSLETRSAIEYRNDVLDLQDSLAAGPYERITGGIQQGINDTYKIRFADGTYGIEKNIHVAEIQQEIGAMRVFREVLGVDEMPAVIARHNGQLTRLEYYTSIAKSEYSEANSFLREIGVYGVQADEDIYTIYFVDGGEHVVYGSGDLEKFLARLMQNAGIDPNAVDTGIGGTNMIMRFADTNQNGADWMLDNNFNIKRLVNDVKNGREIGLFDFIAQNTDRHNGNWLYDDLGETAIPIDHGFTFGNGYWTGAPANYKFYKGWVATTLDAAENRIDVLSVGNAKGVFPGPNMAFKLDELVEIQRKLRAQEGYFTAIGHPAWYKTMQYNLSDLIERKRIYDAENIRTDADMLAYVRKQRFAAQGRQYVQAEFDKAVDQYIDLLAESQWRGMELSDLMARGKLGILTPLQDKAEFEAALKSRLSRNQLRAAAEELVDNPRALQADIDAAVGELKRRQAALSINQLEYIPEDRLSEWAVKNGVDKDTADTFEQLMFDNVSKNNTLGYEVGELHRRLEDFFEQLREMAGEVSLSEVPKAVRPAEIIRHKETVPGSSYTLENHLAAMKRYIDEPYINNILRGVRYENIGIKDIESTIHSLDQAIFSSSLSRPGQFLRIEADPEAVERWIARADLSYYSDIGYVSVIDKNANFAGVGYEGTSDIADQLVDIAVGDRKVYITYELPIGYKALDMRDAGANEFILGEHLLPRDARFEVQGYEFDEDANVLYVTVRPF